MQTFKLLLRKVLEERAVNGDCISYKALASELGVIQAPVIATVTGLLELLIDEDVAAKRPILSALAIQKGSTRLPRSGFFEKLNSLNIIDTNITTFDAVTWHASEIKKLKIFYSNENNR
ncbi:MAG: hypothetical protein OEM38_00040 [Gammaproteobacteria bacterium]|nr:hypothetical protein [Gammaproteobacteria bacterium]